MGSVERVWGSRKFLSFILVVFASVELSVPLMLSLVKPMLPYGRAYLPTGPRALIFALLVQYYHEIPRTREYMERPSPVQRQRNQSSIKLSRFKKVALFLMAVKMALLSDPFPSAAITGVVGGLIGYVWRIRLFPRLSDWRIPPFDIKNVLPRTTQDGAARRARRRRKRSSGRYFRRHPVRR
ncbi:MAG: DNA replication protein [Watsoniomyces obsoletus]|nr:MAG: DNA replication protein [Watsoniomyces obsoletus]